jgi:hypothetical protein
MFGIVRSSIFFLRLGQQPILVWIEFKFNSQKKRLDSQARIAYLFGSLTIEVKIESILSAAHSASIMGEANMKHAAYVCPHDDSKVTRQFIEEEYADYSVWSIWWRCELGRHFHGSPWRQTDWEEPASEPPDPDLEPWPSDDEVTHEPMLARQAAATLTAGQYALRVSLAFMLSVVAFYASSVLLMVSGLSKLV